MTPIPTTHRATALVASVLALIVLTGDTNDPGTLVLGGSEAHAVVGRPLTPASYAGVARRTSRRTTRRVYTAGAATAAMPAGYVTALPAGCSPAGGIYQCGAARYRPYYSGPTLVYAPI